MILTNFSNKNENTYKLSVIVNKDGSCKVEVFEPKEQGRIETRFKENFVEQENMKLKDKLNFENSIGFFENPIFLSTFLHNYLQFSKDDIIKLDNGDYKVEVLVSKGTFYFCMQQLIFDKKTLQPKCMNVFGENGQKVAEVKYELRH